MLIALQVIQLVRRGGPFFRFPDTVESHTQPGQNNTLDAIRLCNDAQLLLPRGATVTIVRPSQAPDYDATIFLTGVGYLPRQRVVAPRLDGPHDDLPMYVLAVRELLSNPAYEQLATFPEGRVYMRK
jgi:hypothetical protein